MTTSGQAENTREYWTSVQAYVLAAICLVLGTAGGYLLRGSWSPRAATKPAPAAQAPAHGAQVTLDDLKRMADKQAEPLKAQLRERPGDAALLASLGNVYYKTHQFGQAIEYYQQSLQADPKSAAVNTDLGNAYYYAGDADRALQAFATALRCDPKYPDALFNTGLIQWRDKADPKAAVATWQKLLASNPNLPQRPQVEEFIARARQHATIPPGTKTDKPAKM